jgi:hypothetical protein
LLAGGERFRGFLALLSAFPAVEGAAEMSGAIGGIAARDWRGKTVFRD